MNEEKNMQAKFILWLRIVIVVCLYIGAVTVLQQLIGLYQYWAYLAGKINQEMYPELFESYRQIQANPLSYLLLSVYNILIFNGVIICSIWLLRHSESARKVLVGLLGFDIIFTAVYFLWKALQGIHDIQYPWIIIFFNTLQVGVIIFLSHPKTAELTTQLSKQKKQKTTPLNNEQIR